jgi:hypothetical protein
MVQRLGNANPRTSSALFKVAHYPLFVRGPKCDFRNGSTTAPPPCGRRGGITPESSRAGQPRAGPLRVQIRVAHHSPNARRVCSSYSPSATLLSARQMSSANGAFGRQDRHDSAGMRLVSTAKGWRSSVRRSTDWVVRHAGQRTQRNQCLAFRAQPIVGENSIGIRLACRSFHAATRRAIASAAVGSTSPRVLGHSRE